MTAPAPAHTTTWRHRLGYGPRRRPLEPHRALPWRLRAASWFPAAAGSVAWAPLPLLLALDDDSMLIAATSQGGLVCLGTALALRWCAGLARATPLILAPIDEDA